MNDRFKFRVWNKREDCYICPPNPQPLLQADGLLAYFTKDTAKAMDFYDIEFCTGLKDKNGKFIYEGDIIQTDYNGVELDKYIYRWESPAFYVEPIEKGKPTGSHYYHYAVCPERSTVIGNIHQNQELLKDEE